MGKNGGLRPNAGRKKANHTIAAEAGRAFIVRFVEEQRAKILQAQLDLALGHYEAEEQKDGTQRVYFKAPDGKAGEYLLNQAYGKPKETTELTGKDGSPIQVTTMTDEQYRAIVRREAGAAEGSGEA